MDIIISFINNWIELPYLAIFIFLTYGLKELFVAFVRGITGRQVPVKYVVFIIATVVAIPYYFIMNAYDTDGAVLNPMKLLVTYAFGTSLYDMVMDPLVNRIRSVITNESN